MEGDPEHERVVGATLYCELYHAVGLNRIAEVHVVELRKLSIAEASCSRRGLFAFLAIASGQLISDCSTIQKYRKLDQGRGLK